MLTNEEIVDKIVAALTKAGVLTCTSPVPWAKFGLVSRKIHAQFDIPDTSLTPIMRRVLFAIGYASGGREIACVGSHVGYALAVVASGAASRAPLERITGLDPNRIANRLARRNLATLFSREISTIIDGESPGDLYSIPGSPDVVLLDLDSPRSGKAGYVDALLSIVDRLPVGAIILAHDPCVPRFASDFAKFHEAIEGHARLSGPWIFPVDRCGLSLSRVS